MSDFEAALSKVPSHVSFGYCSVHICCPSEVEQRQLGYSIAADGEPLWGDGDGDWRRSWVVIGGEGECGDPIFVDMAGAGYPVYTAWHAKAGGILSRSPYHLMACVKLLMPSQLRHNAENIRSH